MLRIVIVFVIITSIACGSYALVLLIRLRKIYRLEFLSSFLYYEIFHLVFGVYGILGGVAIREILLRLDLKSVQIESIIVAIPFFGVPFIIASWYLLIKVAADLINRPVSQRATIFYFSVATASFLVYGLVLRSMPGRNEMDFETVNYFVRIAFYVSEIGVKLYILILVLPAALKSGNLSERIYLTKFGLYMLGMSIAGAIALNYLYFHTIVGLYFMLIFFGSDLVIIFITKSYLRQNASAFKLSENPIEHLFQKYGISKREKEVIYQISLGKSNQEIADELFISLQTVKDHTYNIYRKVNINNRVQLINIFPTDHFGNV